MRKKKLFPQECGYSFTNFLAPASGVWGGLLVLLARKMASCSAKLFFGRPAIQLFGASPLNLAVLNSVTYRWP